MKALLYAYRDGIATVRQNARLVFPLPELTAGLADKLVVMFNSRACTFSITFLSII